MATWDVSKLQLLQRRSIEPIKSDAATLSSRGLYHRNVEVFEHDIHNTTAIIATTNNSRRREGKSTGKPPQQLFFTHFQRALAYERIHELDKAIADYTLCIATDPKYAPSYFNRSGLYYAKGKKEEAMNDIKIAIKLDPVNETYRSNYALFLREKGDFLQAIEETMTLRAIEKFPKTVYKELKAGKSIHELKQINAESLLYDVIPEDEIFTAMSIPKTDRTMKNTAAVVDFLKQLKFFQSLASDAEIMAQIAGKMDMVAFNMGEFIFEKGDPGSHFYVILDGEISIVDTTKNADGEIIDMITFVKLFRGQTFGETALESKGGKRTAGAYISRKANLLSLEADDYQRIMSRYKSVLHEEVEQVLKLCPVFVDWEKKKQKQLASYFISLHYSPGTVILEAGKPVNKLYIIKRGIVKVIKAINKPKVSVKDSVDAQRGVDVKSKQPGLWVLDRNWRGHLQQEALNKEKDQADFTVGLLGSGQVFGELAVLDPEICSPISIISYAAVELFCIDSDILIALGARFNTTTMNVLNESMNFCNPSGEKFDYYFHGKYTWELKKKKILKELKQFR